MDEHTPAIAQLKRVGGSAALDFSNTADREGGVVIVEWLQTYADLIDWAFASGIVDAEQTSALRRLAQADKIAAADALSRARALREAIYRAGSSWAAGGAPDMAALSTINAVLAEGGARRQLEPDEGGFRWGWRREPGITMLDYPLWVVAQMAGDLLTTQAALLRECAAPDCGWLFLDTSRNRSRRWCDMNDCGNRAKAKRHYRRSRGA